MSPRGRSWPSHGLAAALALVAAPLGALALAARPRWAEGLPERLGAAPRTTSAPVWLHASSVGEAHASAPLVRALGERGHALSLSSTTVDGRAALRRAHPGLPSSLAPLDHPWCVDAALSRVNPRALVLVETELWPFWIAAATRRDTPVAIVSGRLSRRSFEWYRRASAFIAPTLARLAAVGARTAEDAARFEVLGVSSARIRVTGDLKLEDSGVAKGLAPDLARAFGDETPVVVAGSTHRGEETALLGAARLCEHRGLSAIWVVAPRRTERAAEVEADLMAAGRRVWRRSRLPRPSAPDVPSPGDFVLVDTLGELPAIYGRASVAFVGGTLVPVGGHNLIEPVHAGSAVVFGPHTGDVRETADWLEESGAGVRAPSAEALGEAIAAWLAHPGQAAKAAAVGARHLAAHGGSATRSADLVDDVLARLRTR